MSFTNRSAKSHRSTKLPNVKLRPAPSVAASSSSSKISRERLGQAEDDEHFRSLQSHNDEEEIDAITFERQAVLNRKPLRGFSLCFTQVQDSKATFQQYASTLGADWSPSLMEFTTHLVANSPGSEKYFVALKHAINLVESKWLTEIRRCWIEDVPFELNQITEKYKLKPLSGFNVCITGFHQREEVSTLIRLITSLGGHVLSEFNLTGQVTHLICSCSLQGKDVERPDYQRSKSLKTIEGWRQKNLSKVQSTGRNDERIEVKNVLKIKCVWNTWLEDCDELQAFIPEAEYLIDKSPPSAERRRAAMAPIEDSLSQRNRILSERVNNQSKTSEEQVGSENGNSTRDKTGDVDDDDKTKIKIKNGLSSRSTVRRLDKVENENQIQKEEKERDKERKLASSHPKPQGLLDSIVSNSIVRNGEKAEEQEQGRNVLNLSRGEKFTENPSTVATTSSSSSLSGSKALRGRDRGQDHLKTLDHKSRILVESSATPDERAFRMKAENLEDEEKQESQGDEEGKEQEETAEEEEEEEEEVRDLFKGLTMAVDPSLSERAEPLRKYLSDQGARVISNEELKSNRDQSLDYYVLPIRPPFKVSDLNLKGNVDLVTYQWVNRCTYFGKVVSSSPSDSNCGLKPCLLFPTDEFPRGMPNSDQISVSFTSMSVGSIEESETKTVLKALGLNYTPAVKRSITTHLIRGPGKNRNVTKEEKARGWGIEIVGMDWLNKALEIGQFIPGVNPKSKEISTIRSTSGNGLKVHRSSSVNIESQNELASSLNGISPSQVGDIGRGSSGSSSKNRLTSLNEQHLEEKNKNPSILSSDRKSSSDHVQADDSIDSRTDSNQGKSSTPLRPPSPMIPISDGATQAAADTVDEVMAMLNERAHSPTGKNRRKIRAPPNRSRSNRLRNGGARSSSYSTPKGTDPADPSNLTNERTPEDIEALLAAHRNAEAMRIKDSLDNQLENSTSSNKEESLRIIYDNPQASKEKKRLLNLMQKAEKEAALKKRKLNQSISTTAPEEDLVNNSSHTSQERSSTTKSDSNPTSPPPNLGAFKKMTSPPTSASKKIVARKQPGSRR